MSKASPISLYWLTQDLRLHDNQAFEAAAGSAALLCVYVLDEKQLQTRRWQSTPLGKHRWQFIQQSLVDLDNSLQALGQKLFILQGDTVTILAELIRKYAIDSLLTANLPGTYEKAVVEVLAGNFNQLDIRKFDNYTLFGHKVLPFDIPDWPETYTAFKKKAEKFPVSAPGPAVSALPPPPEKDNILHYQIPEMQTTVAGKGLFKGGEQAGLRHLESYFASSLPSAYKQVRNSLDGWQNSSKFSPWLNQGCLSPRQLRSVLTSYESDKGRNESTHWFYLELLWREYFQWLSHKLGKRLFAFSGISDRRPGKCFYGERFIKWCTGQTPYPLVNACMRELAATGYLSNRGRQIVASCLINELGVDWRYGATWFEHQLIDYDVATNWGNWQYIAGVGVDPRGGRHFNLQKQAEIFDPEGEYQHKWGGVVNYPLDSVDAADWPIEYSQEDA